MKNRENVVAVVFAGAVCGMIGYFTKGFVEKQDYIEATVAHIVLDEDQGVVKDQGMFERPYTVLHHSPKPLVILVPGRFTKEGEKVWIPRPKEEQ